MQKTAALLFWGCLFAMATATPAQAQLRADVFATGFSQPVAFVQDPTDTATFMVVQQDGRIRVVRNGVVQSAPFLDLTAVVRNSGEQGLLSLVFAPDYAASGRFYVFFINNAGNAVIARFRRSDGSPLQADPSSRFDLEWPGGQRWVVQPFTNHKGGYMAFGPDGFLYLGMGDGGNANDPNHFAQNPISLLGKMLRIDVSVADSDTRGYRVPANNPFSSSPGVLSEIWSFGLRNPWRWSFDNSVLGGTGAMVIADVGQAAWEEINYEPSGRSGRNYGWRNREGAHDHVTSLPPFSQPLTDPIFEYSHALGASITGGFVYRGSAIGFPFRGRYVFGDFVSSRIWSIALTINVSTGEATASDFREHTSELGAGASSPASFGEDANGELYVVSYGGTIYRLNAATAPPVIVDVKKRPAGVAPIGFAIPRASPGGSSAPPSGRAAPLVVVAPADEEPPPAQDDPTTKLLLMIWGPMLAAEIWRRAWR